MPVSSFKNISPVGQGTVTVKSPVPRSGPGMWCGWFLILICKWRTAPPLLAQVTHACIGSGSLENHQWIPSHPQTTLWEACPRETAHDPRQSCLVLGPKDKDSSGQAGGPKARDAE